jgi:PKD repeat protein
MITGGHNMRYLLLVLLAVLMMMPVVAAPVVSFIPNISTGSVTVPVQFTDTSPAWLSGATWQWNETNIPYTTSPTTFSSLQNPTETFGVGNFTVELTITNGTFVNSSQQWINVSGAGTINHEEDYGLVQNMSLTPSDSIWKAPVDSLPLHPLSDTYIAHENPKYYMYIATDFHINVVNSSVLKQNFIIISPLPLHSDRDPVPIPDNVIIGLNTSDRNIHIVDKDTNTSYESYFDVKLPNGTWKTWVTKKYNLADNILLPDNHVAAGLAGLRKIDGMLRYAEVANGSVDHALYASMFTTQATHVWPARNNGVQKNPEYPPVGQRFRLNASFDDSAMNANDKIIVAALKKYGLILCENSHNSVEWLFYADDDPRWDTKTTYWDFRNNGPHASDFEAVDATVLMISPTTGQANLQAMVPVASFSATPTSGAFPLTVTFSGMSPFSAKSYFWEFGDNSTSKSASPTHTYTTAGTYNVNVLMTNDYGSDWNNTTASINVYESPWVAYRNDPLSVFSSAWGLIGVIAAIILTGLGMHYLKWVRIPKEARETGGIWSGILVSMLEGVVILTILFVGILYIGGPMAGM